MNKNKTLAIALSVLFSSSLALADSEVSGKMVLEQGSLQDGGTLKNEMKIKLYADGDITDNMTYHAELQGSSDSDKVGGYSGEYTQNANLRELYVDMSGGDWEARLGKQQVVWGTADGMKLLDIINPTDYAEMAQDQMEDARIPVWALNLESGSVQVVISEPKENVFAGLNRGTDTAVRHNAADGSDIDGVGTDAGNAFLMMGPDTITGSDHGFLNIVPDLGSIAGGFGQAFVPLNNNGTPLDPSDDTFVDGDLSGLGNPLMNDLMSAFTVGAFTNPTATLATLSQDFKNMQIGKTMAYWAVGGDDFNPATTGDNPDFSDFTDTAGNANDDGDVLTSDTMEDMGAYQAGIQTMGFEHLNFSASVVGMACNSPDPAMAGAIAQLSCAAEDFIADYATNIVVGLGDDGIAGPDPITGVNDDPTMTLAQMFAGAAVLDGWAADYDSNLSSFSMDTAFSAAGGQDSAFEYMTDTGFRTFDTFVNALRLD